MTADGHGAVAAEATLTALIAAHDAGGYVELDFSVDIDHIVGP